MKKLTAFLTLLLLTVFANGIHAQSRKSSSKTEEAIEKAADKTEKAVIEATDMKHARPYEKLCGPPKKV